MSKRINAQEMNLLKAMDADVNNFESYFGGDNYDSADAPAAPVLRQGQKLQVQQSKYNPPFKAQFDITISLKYFTVAAGVFTVKTAAQIIAAVATTSKFAFFLFGRSDFESGYTRMNTEFPQVGGNWVYGIPFTYGSGFPFISEDGVLTVLDATAYNSLSKGDVVIPYTLTTGGVNYVCLVVIHCNNTQYSALLSATNSDKFVLNMIRYIVADAYVDQFNNEFKFVNQSLFGKRSVDTISPTSNKNPEQNQIGIIDVPVEYGVTKETGLGSYIDYNVILVKLSIFVWGVQKV
jgi:hypothetical protein